MLPAMNQALSVMEPFLWLVGALLLGAGVIALFQRWSRRREGADDSMQDQLSNFRELYEQGQLSEEEYKRLHGLLSGKIRERMDMPAVEKPEEPKDNGHPAKPEDLRGDERNN